MIRTICIRGFKCFETEVEFHLPGHVVLAGPNDAGKTTILQAVASWSIALQRWRELDDFNPRQGYTRAPIARQAFVTVPLGNFDLLWPNRLYQRNHPVEIELRHDDGWSVTMELTADSTEQIYVRPGLDADPEVLRTLDHRTVFIPPMTGVGLEEPVYMAPKIEQLLCLGRPGEVLRNLLVEANDDPVAWDALQASIKTLFGYRLRSPDTYGAHIIAEYVSADLSAPHLPLDIASAGSGFQQVLMLLVLLNTRPGAVLLLDEPDAHLDVILQDVIYQELRTAAARQHSQLIIATHSEVIINSTEPHELHVIPAMPQGLVESAKRSQEKGMKA